MIGITFINLREKYLRCTELIKAEIELSGRYKLKNYCINTMDFTYKVSVRAIYLVINICIKCSC